MKNVIFAVTFLCSLFLMVTIGGCAQVDKRIDEATDVIRKGADTALRTSEEAICCLSTRGALKRRYVTPEQLQEHNAYCNAVTDCDAATEADAPTVE